MEWSSLIGLFVFLHFWGGGGGGGGWTRKLVVIEGDMATFSYSARPELAGSTHIDSAQRIALGRISPQ